MPTTNGHQPGGTPPTGPDLQALHQAVQALLPQFRKVIRALQREGVAEAPVFVAAPQPVPALGRPFARALAGGHALTFHASFLPVLVKQGVVQADKVAAFQSAWQDPQTRACVVVVDADQPRVLFVPLDGSTPTAN